MLYVEGKHELRACDTQLRLGVSYLKEYVALNNTNGFSGITIRAEIYFTLYARDSAYSARDKFRHQNSTVRAGRACALNSRAVISLSTRWKHCHGGGGGGGVSVHKVAEEKHMASHTSGVSVDTVRLPKR